MTKKLHVEFGPVVEWRIIITKAESLPHRRIDSYKFLKMVRGVVRTFTLLLLALNVWAFPKVGPEYKTPTNNVPETYKASELGQWKEGKPADGVTKGRWWQIFNDATLNSLE